MLILLFLILIAILISVILYMLNPSLDNILKEAWDKLNFFDWNKE